MTHLFLLALYDMAHSFIELDKAVVHVIRFPLGISEVLTKSPVATGLEKVSFHSSPKEKQCQRMLKLLHNCTHLIH